MPVSWTGMRGNPCLSIRQRDNLQLTALWRCVQDKLCQYPRKHDRSNMTDLYITSVIVIVVMAALMYAAIYNGKDKE